MDFNNSVFPVSYGDLTDKHFKLSFSKKLLIVDVNKSLLLSNLVFKSSK